MTLATTYHFSVTIAGTPLSGSPIELHICPGAASGKRSYLLSMPPMPIPVHELCEFRVQACDQYGNRLSQGGSAVLCKAAGPGGMPIDVTDAHDGTCEARAE